METYSFLREFADSWFLVAMFVFYLVACSRPFWPRLRQGNIEAANIPFRNDELVEPHVQKTKSCAGTCENCKAIQSRLEDS